MNNNETKSQMQVLYFFRITCWSIHHFLDTLIVVKNGASTIPIITNELKSEYSLEDAEREKKGPQRLLPHTGDERTYILLF